VRVLLNSAIPRNGSKFYYVDILANKRRESSYVFSAHQEQRLMSPIVAIPSSIESIRAYC